jgi:hypothetical protein
VYPSTRKPHQASTIKVVTSLRRPDGSSEPYPPDLQPEPELINVVHRRRHVHAYDRKHDAPCPMIGFDFRLVVDSGTTKNLFPIHMLSNLERHEEWICGVGSRPLHSPCKGTVRLLLTQIADRDTNRSAVVDVDAWGLEAADVGPRFEPLLSLASLVRAGVGFHHIPGRGPELLFPSGKELSLAFDYRLLACRLADDAPRTPAQGNA